MSESTVQQSGVTIISCLVSAVAIDVVNAHGGWLSFVVLPSLVVLCVTNVPVLGLACALGGFLLCWSLGFR